MEKVHFICMFFLRRFFFTPEARSIRLAQIVKTAHLPTIILGANSINQVF